MVLREIAADAVLQVLRLADVQDLPVVVEELVDAGLVGKQPGLLANIEFVHVPTKFACA